MNRPNRLGEGSGLIAVAIVAAALILSWAIPDSPRYQLASSDTAVFRMDTDSGALIACNSERCAQVQEPDRAKTIGAFKLQLGSEKQSEPPAPALVEQRR